MSRRNKSRPRGAQPNTEAVSVQDAFSNPLFRLGYGSQSPLEATEYPLTRMTDNYALLNSPLPGQLGSTERGGHHPGRHDKEVVCSRRSGGAGAPEGTGSRSARDGAPGAGQRGTAVGQAVRRRRRTYHDPRTGGVCWASRWSWRAFTPVPSKGFTYSTAGRAWYPVWSWYSRAESRCPPITPSPTPGGTRWRRWTTQGWCGSPAATCPSWSGWRSCTGRVRGGGPIQ